MSWPATAADSDLISDQPSLPSRSNSYEEETMTQDKNKVDTQSNFTQLGFELEMAQLEAAKREQQRENEINSATQSLSTNLIVSFVFLGFTIISPFFNELLLVTVLSLLKVLIPVIAVASNFVIIHSLLLERVQNCLDTFIHH